MPILSAAVQCPAVKSQSYVNRLAAVPGNKDSLLAEDICLPPVNDLAYKARQEVSSRFVVRLMMNLYAQHMTVIENYQRPAIHSLKGT
jgi:hypothetical protein